MRYDSRHDGRRGRMKSFTVATMILALVAVPAQAQMGGRRNHGDDKKADQKKTQVDDKAYKAALERIPEIAPAAHLGDRKSTRLNSSHMSTSYAVFCLK